MSRLRICLLLAVLCSCSQYGLGDSITSPRTIIIPLEPHQELKKVAAPEIVETTTQQVTTTEQTTTESTPASTTTTSTTPKQTTTTTTTTTTTPTPSPKPTPAPTPTPAPAPAPVPAPDQGTWSFTDTKTNVTCIVAQFAAQLNVTYTKAVNNATSLSYVLLNVPANATVVSGNCTEGDQWIWISWPTLNASLPNNLTMTYHRNETTKDYGLKSFNISLAPENFVNGSSVDPIDLYHGAEWVTPLATSYRCKTATHLNMTSESAGSVVAVLTLSRLQEEAYRTTPGNGFSAARECGGGDVPDAVPIAVGCALGGLVVLVLVAYLVGRRRSAARGYLSM